MSDNWSIEKVTETVKKKPLLWGAGAVLVVGAVVLMGRRSETVNLSGYPSVEQEELPVSGGSSSQDLDQLLYEIGLMNRESLQTQSEMLAGTIKYLTESFNQVNVGGYQEVYVPPVPIPTPTPVPSPVPVAVVSGGGIAYTPSQTGLSNVSSGSSSQGLTPYTQAVRGAVASIPTVATSGNPVAGVYNGQVGTWNNFGEFTPK